MSARPRQVARGPGQRTCRRRAQPPRSRGDCGALRRSRRARWRPPLLASSDLARQPELIGTACGRYVGAAVPQAVLPGARPEVDSGKSGHGLYDDNVERVAELTLKLYQVARQLDGGQLDPSTRLVAAIGRHQRNRINPQSLPLPGRPGGPAPSPTARPRDRSSRRTCTETV